VDPFGFQATWRAVRRALAPRTKAPDTLATQGYSSGGWWPLVRESFPGAWQRDIVSRNANVLTYGTVWACITLIAADIAKLWVMLVEKDAASGVCSEITSPVYSPVLRKPNHYQTRVKFFESWVMSRLVAGNAYILKERNDRGGPQAGNVVALYVLDPSRVQVQVAPDGAVYYALGADQLSGLTQSVVVPASEIIHDICVPLFHPLIGVSPLYASGMAAMQGLQIQDNSSKLFANGSNLSGVLTAPDMIPDELAKRIQEHWEKNFVGTSNVGKVAVLGSGLKFEPMTMTAVDAQLIDQLKWTSEQVCATFHVPGYMVGIGSAPPYTDIQSINLQYYAQALQNPIENMEVLLEEGLELPSNYGIEFDLDALARMDTKTQMATAKDGIAAGILSPNEGRARFDLLPVPGGDSPYLQQQNYSLEALAKRDAQTDPFATVRQPPVLPPIVPPRAMMSVEMQQEVLRRWTTMEAA